MRTPAQKLRIVGTAKSGYEIFIKKESIGRVRQVKNKTWVAYFEDAPVGGAAERKHAIRILEYDHAVRTGVIKE